MRNSERFFPWESESTGINHQKGADIKAPRACVHSGSVYNGDCVRNERREV